jgi:endonuclease-3
MSARKAPRSAQRELAALRARAGTERLAADRWPRQWQALIAILLSARTRDDITIPVARALFRHRPRLADLTAAPLPALEETIRPVNFYRTKAKRVSGCARALHAQHGGKVPKDPDTLETLPGVGRKTAQVFLASTGAPALGVDTHVARIARKLGWSDAPDPKRVEADLKALFPRSSWRAVNPTLVRIGRMSGGKEAEDRLLAEIAGS